MDLGRLNLLILGAYRVVGYFPTPDPSVKVGAFPTNSTAVLAARFDPLTFKG